MAVKLIDRHMNGFVRAHELCGIAPQVAAAHEMLSKGTGMGNDFIGWLDLPVNYDPVSYTHLEGTILAQSEALSGIVAPLLSWYDRRCV